MSPRTTAVHPDAAIFPMMTDDELAELAADIKANGQIHPIVLDAEGRLVDGRNRQRACEIAGIEPRTVLLNGASDVKAFIVSANLERRNLSKGQQAMALAMLYPEPERGRGKKDNARKGAETSSFSYRRVEQARAILRHSRGAAEDVLAGRKHFDVALRETEVARQQSASVEARMAELRDKAPDVAAMVDDERLTLEAGLTEVREREQKLARIIAAAAAAVERLNELPEHVEVIEDGIAADAEAPWLDDLELDAIADALGRLADLRRRRRKR